MKCTTPEISWHNRDPVLSVDVQGGFHETFKCPGFWRVATGGADSHVLIWHLIANESGGVTAKCVADLERHQKAVNVVRFSPSKEILASGDDESVIILWKQREDCEFFVPSDDDDNKEQWASWKVLKGHLEDIYDISWSPDSTSFVSGSVDNTAILWDIHKGRSTAILSDHKGFVQGVSWDPLNRYICTISTDRICRLIDINTKKTVQRVYKSKVPTPEDHPIKDKVIRLFYDDTFKSFFRRLTFSLDGTLIIVPSGIIEPLETTEKISNATIVFSRHNLKEPLAILPSLDECTIAVRCCPVYFELRENGPPSLIPLPYRMVFAVATQHSIFIYDTQQTTPVALISNIHYTRLTDLAWSSDGGILIACSTDGYCSIIRFQKGELGVEHKRAVHEKSEKEDSSKPLPVSNLNDQNPAKNPLPTVDVDNSAMDIDIAKCTKSQMHITNEIRAEIKENHKVSTPITADKGKPGPEEETEDINLVYNEESGHSNIKSAVKKTPPKLDAQPTVLNKTPRRVKLITLSSPKNVKRVERKAVNMNE